MAFADDYEFGLLVNDAFEAVIAELDYQLSLEENEDACRCHDCVLDMAALALNNVKPAYRSSLVGVIYAQKLYNDDETKNEIENAVREAIAKVKANPLHSVESEESE
ncbi:MAG: late competence development ComFB family protein [Spirochaetales bacterium]|nr:late competence development ComFB family protein [Spirochaetales bacterium]